MKITLKRTPEQLELIKAMASKNRDTAYAAQVALAEFIGPVVSEVQYKKIQSSWWMSSLPHGGGLTGLKSKHFTLP